MPGLLAFARGLLKRDGWKAVSQPRMAALRAGLDCVFDFAYDFDAVHGEELFDMRVLAFV